MTPPAHLIAAPGSARSDLEAALVAVESGLACLADALRARDGTAVDAKAVELHHALARAVERFSGAARHGSVPHGLRHRLIAASGQLAAQRESLARATAQLDRALDVLLPQRGAAAPTYSAGALHGATRSRSFMS